MKHAKKIILFVVVSLSLASFIQPIGADQSSDTFDVTVIGEYLSIDITNATWAIGDVVYSSSHWTNETDITFIADMDTCTVTTDLSLQITNDGATWNSATSGNGPASDTYRLNASINTWSGENQVLASGDTVISSSIAEGNDETFDLRFDAPTTSTTGTQQSITVTATIVKS